MILDSRKVLEGEKEVYLSQEIDQGYKSIYLEPYPKANPRAIDEIINADMIVIGPGGLHTSIIPNLLVDGICDALCQSHAKKTFVVNLMNRKGQTTGYKVGDYLKEMVRFIGKDIFDYILVNDQAPPHELIEVYAQEGDLVANNLVEDRVRLANLLGEVEVDSKTDLLKRNLIRHDSKKLAQELMKIVNHL
jgi:uncharacterized cofD-like protein